MPECLIFKHGCCIGTSGGVRPCCAFDTHGVETIDYEDDWKTRHLEWYEQSKTQWLPQCKECEQDEKLNGKSLRIDYNRKLKDADGIAYWDLKINNTCNLQCRMCDSASSSQWEQHATFEMHPFYRIGQTRKWHKEAKELVAEMLTAKYVKFTGGEPLLIPQVKHIIELLIEYEASYAIQLELITNGTQDLLPYIKYFDKFKQVNINISVDAIGKRYEYIRPNANWDLVSNNILDFNKNKPNNTFITIACLPMALNYKNINEVEAWCKQNKLQINIASPVIFPKFMRIESLSDPIQRKVLIKNMELQDAQHGTNWRDFIDE